MSYTLAVGAEQRTIPDGTNLLLLHPSTGETDRIDTDFLRTDTDQFLVVSTRTTAREVEQKLEYYEVDRDRAVILDTLSVERGYSRRTGEGVHYVGSPDDVDGIVDKIGEFLSTAEGQVRVSFDSVTELAYYAGDDAAREGVERMVDLVAEYGAVSLFHLSPEVHDDEEVVAYRDLFDGVIELDDEGTIDIDI